MEVNLRSLIDYCILAGVLGRRETICEESAISHRISLEVVDKTGLGFPVLPLRWTVERTFAWLLNYRRYSRDYEVRTEK